MNKYLINVQAGIEVLTFQITAQSKTLAKIKAEWEAGLMTDSDNIKVLSIRES